MRSNRKRSAKSKTTDGEKRPKVVQKIMKNAELLDLPSLILKKIIDNLSLADHEQMRLVCSFIHEEIEIYWRTQRCVTVEKMIGWFPKLKNEEKWRIQSTTTMIYQLRATFNLINPSNLQSLSFAGIKTVNFEAISKILKFSTCDPKFEHLENVKELDLRGCLIRQKDFRLISKMFPKLRVILLDDWNYVQRNIIIPTGQKYSINKLTGYEKTIGETKIGVVSSIDQKFISVIEEHCPNIESIFMNLSLE